MQMTVPVAGTNAQSTVMANEVLNSREKMWGAHAGTQYKPEEAHPGHCYELPCETGVSVDLVLPLIFSSRFR